MNKLLSMIIIISLAGYSGLWIKSPNYVKAVETPVIVTSQSTFEIWLEGAGIPLYSKYNKYRASYQIYRDYKILCYGNAAVVSGNRYDTRTKQYAYLGYSYDEFKLTNTYFPNDSSGSSNPYGWNELDHGQAAEVSWLRLSSRQKNYIKSAPIYFMGNNYGGMNFTNLSLTERNTVVIAPPSWYLGFYLYTKHNTKYSGIMYATFHGYGTGGATTSLSISSSAFANDGNIHIPSGQSSLSVVFKIYGKVDSFSSLSLPSDISSAAIKGFGQIVEKTGSGPWVTEVTRNYQRESFNKNEIYSRKISEKIGFWIKTVFGDIIYKEQIYSFTIVEDPYEIKEEIVSVTGDISYFDGKNKLSGRIIPYNPRRFLAYENITLTVMFTGNSIPETITAVLPSGTTRHVRVSSGGTSAPQAILRTNLEFLQSTIKWDGTRVRIPYSIVIIAHYESGDKRIVYGGIEITGTVYDILYTGV